MMVSLLVAVFRRVAAVQDEVVEVAGAANAVHLFVLVRRRARSADQIGDKQWIDAWTVAATGVERLSRVASFTSVMTCHLVCAKVAVALMSMTI